MACCVQVAERRADSKGHSGLQRLPISLACPEHLATL